MVKVNNKIAVRNLARKSFRASRIRNIFAIIAIALTSLLFTSLFTLGMGTVESIQQASLRQSGGDGHAVLKYISDKEYETVKKHPLVKEISYSRMLSDDVENKELLKRRAEFWYDDDVGLKLGFITLDEGSLPVAENEVIADSKTLELLGVELEVGAPIRLEMNIKGEKVVRDFILSGWWESDPAFNVGQIFSSQAYVDAHEAELQNTYTETSYISGCLNTYIMFENSSNLESKLEQVLLESGFSLDEDASNYVNSNVNWAYLSTNFGLDLATMVALVGGIFLIGLTGYLIIYNIFQISVIRDIKHYGLLKTIGTTAKQIKQMMFWQAVVLSVVGIPIGLVLGFFAGKAFVPLLMSNSSFPVVDIVVTPVPIIFIGAALFAFATVFISTRKPAKIASKVSPIEAAKYNDSMPSKRYTRGTKGTKVCQMARANMSRNSKRTTLVVISLSLSIVLLNTVVTLAGSIDLDKFVAKFVDTDFLIAHADYFNIEYFGKENQTSEQFIASVQQLDGFEEGGRLFGGRDIVLTLTDEENKSHINQNAQGEYFAACFGLEQLPFERLELLDGEKDMQRLLSGNYILEGVRLDDNENPMMDTANFAVGESVTLNIFDSGKKIAQKEYSVLGHVAIKTYTNSDRVSSRYTFYLPAEIYKEINPEAGVMSYAFNVADDNEQQVEQFLKEYTDKIEPLMNFESKQTTVEAFVGMRNTVLVIGSGLGVIIGLIGILNFINSILTSIIIRRHEFAMLQSIGMTQKQLRAMLCYEGGYYALYAAVTSVVLGAGFSFIVVRALCGQMWFASYHFIFWPLMVSLPILALLGLIIPLVLFSFTGNTSITQRLREAE